ncbi:MAG: redox-regulated ATPase YchF [Metamycoplasmataceae bacterium]
MGYKAGIVGLPNVGKSTLFSGLTKMKAEASNYAFTTIDPNIAFVELNDERIKILSKMVNTKKEIKATFEFVDIAGLVKGASKGEGLGNQFLSNIREVDLIIHVIRCFENKDILHVSNSVDPIRDYEVIMLELILADLQTLINIRARISRRAQNTNDPKLNSEYELLNKAISHLEDQKPIKTMTLTDNEIQIMKQFQLLTSKDMLLVGNVDSENAANPENEPNFKKLLDFSKEKNLDLISISISIESEIGFLDDEDKEVFLNEYNLKESGLDNLIKKTFKKLNLSTYFTVGEQETRAWVFENGRTAPECAGIIHTDFQKNFIKAEVISYDDYINYGGEKGCKENGKTRLEGKSYLVKDGDICHFRIGKN